MQDSPLIDPRNQAFVLDTLLEVESLCALPAFSEHSRETFAAALDAAHDLAMAQFAPHNRASDIAEPTQVDGRVQVIPEVRAALRSHADSGFAAMTAAVDEGGMGLPHVLALACDALFLAANVSTTSYALLARGAAHLLRTYGDPRQKRLYMQPLLDGRFGGTMCLSEPQAGSSLGDIRTRATPTGDGRYRLDGAKMWISGGEHDLYENIVHLVLARIDGASPGVRGISLFVVPRNHVADDGSVGERNDVKLAGVNHKLGQRGIVNTFLKFGEGGECIAERVGAEHQGLACMFHMMNEARIGVGMGAVMLGYAGYRYALQYARERRQGRHVDQRDATTLPVAIIEHADVRRMLLKQRALVEGGYALALYAARLVDLAAHARAPEARADAQQLLDLLTPLVKGWSAEQCVIANDLAIQVLGGYGYTREYPVEQLWRDNRLNPIHEGSNGIQALDLLGRKVAAAEGAALRLLLQAVDATCNEVLSDAAAIELQPLAAQLEACSVSVSEATRASQRCAAGGDPRRALANASSYLTAVGHYVVGWLWLQQAQTARRQLAAGRGDADFLRGKIQTCLWFFRHELPQVPVWLANVAVLDDSALAMQPEWF